MVGQQWKSDITQELQSKLIWKVFILRGSLFKSGKIWEVSLSGVVIQLELTMIKQIIWDWSGNNVKMTLHSNFKLSYLKKIQNVLKDSVSIWCDLISLATRSNHLVKNWSSYKKERRISQATTGKWRQTAAWN